ncbi:uncharacterized protein LOC124720465 isoform X1 [Schistocerca piceifrons]|uniref:uncharacterized protein LOC124720465 isoform X1 n=1 Tax=Schistocerca piceifrons TaxID=274613 RepID=UPI001F5F7780|nr:uncharacterized protein LOC124720465 isoform X1 [Schistocerca piceifrons]
MQWSPEKVKGLGTAIMDDKKTNWIKKEEANEFLDEPLGASWFTDCIKEDPGLNLGWDETENNFLEDPHETSCSTDFIKEDPELNLEDDENETIVSIHISGLFHVDQGKNFWLIV